MRLFFCLLLLLGMESCFLFRDYKRREFSFMRTGDSMATTVAIIVPKGFKSEEKIADSLGRQGVAYHYLDGAELYIVFDPLGDNFQVFDTVGHIPQPYLQGGVFYKGIDSTKRWWREAQPPFFRIGYRNVTSESEVLFDSAVNYVKPGMPQHRRKTFLGAKKA
jgi:hypothetical protein